MLVVPRKSSTLWATYHPFAFTTHDEPCVQTQHTQILLWAFNKMLFVYLPLIATPLCAGNFSVCSVVTYQVLERFHLLVCLGPGSQLTLYLGFLTFAASPLGNTSFHRSYKNTLALFTCFLKKMILGVNSGPCTSKTFYYWAIYPALGFLKQGLPK